jgi:hypothetical protein
VNAAIGSDLGKHLPHCGDSGAHRMIAVDDDADIAELTDPGLGQIRIGRRDHHQPGPALPAPGKGDDLVRGFCLEWTRIISAPASLWDSTDLFAVAVRTGSIWKVAIMSAAAQRACD